jgi:hypothetical protein
MRGHLGKLVAAWRRWSPRDRAAFVAQLKGEARRQGLTLETWERGQMLPLTLYDAEGRELAGGHRSDLQHDSAAPWSVLAVVEHLLASIEDAEESALMLGADFAALLDGRKRRGKRRKRTSQPGPPF